MGRSNSPFPLLSYAVSGWLTDTFLKHTVFSSRLPLILILTGFHRNKNAKRNEQKAVISNQRCILSFPEPSTQPRNTITSAALYSKCPVIHARKNYISPSFVKQNGSESTKASSLNRIDPFRGRARKSSQVTSHCGRNIPTTSGPQ